MSAARALALRTAADARVRTLAFSLLFAGVTVATTAGYSRTYPTVAERLQFARTFGANKAARLFYGTPHRLDTLGGFASWRGGGLLAVFAAFFGALAAVRALRGEEESGRAELVASGAVTRRSAFAARLAAVGATIVALWLATFVGLAGGGLVVSGSAYLALATLTPAVVYAGVGALASQLMPSRRGALELAGAFLGLDLVVRVVSDTADLQGLHWAIPLGWVEELRPFAHPRPAVLVLPVLASSALVSLSLAVERRRDLGAAVFAAHDVAAPRPRLLGSPTRLALRSQRVGLAVWILATGGFGLTVGTVSKSVASAGLSANLRERLHRIGSIEVATASGYIGLTFLFFVLAVALFCCGQLAAARDEEADGRLETLFALPQSRVRWLAGRLGLAAAGATSIALAAGLGAALGARAVGADVSVPRLLEAGLNCLPACALFLGVGAVLVAALPRLGVGVAYALVSVAFVWELFGALLGAPSWLLGVSPFHQIALVPAAPFRAGPAAAMLGIGAEAAAAALVRFRSRDLAGA
jgi:ABC-2 type transport system permease protein